MAIMLHTDRQKKPARIFVFFPDLIIWFFFYASALSGMSSPLLFLTVDGILVKYQRGA